MNELTIEECEYLHAEYCLDLAVCTVFDSPVLGVSWEDKPIDFYAYLDRFNFNDLVRYSKRKCEALYANV